VTGSAFVCEYQIGSMASRCSICTFLNLPFVSESDGIQNNYRDRVRGSK
jgi:hypothetical protein